MPYFKNAQEWYEQSSLLVQARPSTVSSKSVNKKYFRMATYISTLVTTKYTVPNADRARLRKRAEARRKHTAAKAAAAASKSDDVDTAAEDAAAATSTHQTIAATLTLKTYDPVSGTCLKYETNKQQDVGRLIGSLSRLGRAMAALPMNDGKPSASGGLEKEADGDVIMADAGKKDEDPEAPSVKSAVGQDTSENTGASAGAGGKKSKKKKGKK